MGIMKTLDLETAVDGMPHTKYYLLDCQHALVSIGQLGTRVKLPVKKANCKVSCNFVSSCNLPGTMLDSMS